jgi:hypothetical protein
MSDTNKQTIIKFFVPIKPTRIEIIYINNSLRNYERVTYSILEGLKQNILANRSYEAVRYNMHDV